MDSKYNINTDQNVAIEVKISGIGDRLIALFFDSLILVGVGISLSIFLSFLNFLSNDFIFAVWAIFGFLAFLYHFIQEWLFKGQTIGKVARNIKVVRSNGTDAGFFQYLIRNLIRPIDSFYGIGLVVLFFNKKYQRLGDMAAGTIVIKVDKKVSSLQDTIFKEIDSNYEPKFNRLAVLKLSSKDIELIKELTNKPNNTINWDLVVLLAEKIRKKTGLDNEGLNNKDFLQTLVKDYFYHSLN